MFFSTFGLSFLASSLATKMFRMQKVNDDIRSKKDMEKDNFDNRIMSILEPNFTFFGYDDCDGSMRIDIFQANQSPDVNFCWMVSWWKKSNKTYWRRLISYLESHQKCWVFLVFQSNGIATDGRIAGMVSFAKISASMRPLVETLTKTVKRKIMKNNWTVEACRY